jgi:hypothetical protein
MHVCPQELWHQDTTTVLLYANGIVDQIVEKIKLVIM